MAPVGLVSRRGMAFELGMETAALTHGHPSGYLSAGFLALLIDEIVSGASLTDSIQMAKQCLLTKPGHEGVLNAVESALLLAKSDAPHTKLPILGQGWVAEEALAIGLYCALVGPNSRMQSRWRPITPVIATARCHYREHLRGTVWRWCDSRPMARPARIAR